MQLMSTGNNIKVLSANCQGLQTKEKRVDVLSYFKDQNANIICLQDTHWTRKDLKDIKKLWEGDCYIHGLKTNSRGVAILLNKNFEFEIVTHEKDTQGNFLYLLLKLSSMTLSLITVYGPNKDDPKFFGEIQNILKQNETDYTIICGDFNVVLNPEKDTQNYKHLNNPRSRQRLLNTIDQFGLVDIYRYINPESRRYTWRKRQPIKQARLDFFLINTSMVEIVMKSNIKTSYRSDHSVIELQFLLNKFSLGKGVWKFNNSLLKHS